MARPKEYERLTVDDIDMKGHGVVRAEGFILFVEGALPGDLVDVSVRRRRSGHGQARLLRIHESTIERIEPFCAHFDDCGGCTWQHLPYEAQLRLKERMVAQAFRRFGVTGPSELPADGSAAPPVEERFEAYPILGCDETRHYRNRLDYSFSSRRWIPRREAEQGEVGERGGSVAAQTARKGALGFHAPGRFDKVLEIERCHLQGEPTNAIRNALADFTAERGYAYYDPVEHTGYLRNLVVRTSLEGEVLVLLVFAYDEPVSRETISSFLRERFPEITSLYYLVNPTKNDDLAPHEARLYSGAEAIRERCGPLELAIHPKSFYQTNPTQAERLYGVVREWAALTGSELLLDLYCGAGSIALFLADRCRRVVGLEIVSEAVERARENAASNGIGNAEFHLGAAEAVLPQWAAEGMLPDLVVTDPPRAGMHPKAIEALLAMRPKRVIYVSCNPRSQAEDVASLTSAYRMVRYRPVDMFPHTRHVENVVELSLG